MLRKREIGKFVKVHIAPHFPGFHLYRRKDLVLVRRPLLHGICFSQSEWSDVFYVICYVEFLTDPSDVIGLGFGERTHRLDRWRGSLPENEKLAEQWTNQETEAFHAAVKQIYRADTWTVEPAEAAHLLEAMKKNRYSPFNLDATCANVLKLAGGKKQDGGHVDFGLGTCAVFENDSGLARMHFDRVKQAIGTPDTDWRRELLNRTLTIESLLGDLSAAQLKLRQWVEESIQLLKLEKFA